VLGLTDPAHGGRMVSKKTTTKEEEKRYRGKGTQSKGQGARDQGKGKVGGKGKNSKLIRAR